MSNSQPQNYARLVTWAVTVPFAALSLLALGILWGTAQATPPTMVFAAIYYLPMALYLWAMWMVRSALARIARGASFSEVIPTLLERAGAALFVGALFTVFGVPLVTWLFSGRPYITTFEPSAVTLGVMGAAMTVFGRSFAQAKEMRDELDGFF